MLSNLGEFIKLSTFIHYQIGASPDTNYNLLFLMIGDKEVSQKDKNIVLDVIQYLRKAYGDRKRRLGPYAIVHPIRATALLVQALDRITSLDLLTELLHDKGEDITLEDFPYPQFENDYFKALEDEFKFLLNKIDPDDNWFLMERISWLTRQSQNETYYDYIGKLLNKSHKTPELVRVKLADRLDNTLDFRKDF
jgi:(p)ppGpp synthase/HD superfamily hydrolase